MLGTRITSLAVLLSAVPFFSQASQAQTFTFSDPPSNTLVTDIQGLDVGGSLFDVTFRSGSFNSVFGDASTFDFSTLPFTTFSTAQQAATALNAALLTTQGITESSHSSISDGFVIPFESGFSGFFGPEIRLSLSDPDLLNDSVSQSTFLASTNLGNGGFRTDLSYAEFTPATAVPIPALLPSLIGFGIAAFRKRKLAQSDAD